MTSHSDEMNFVNKYYTTDFDVCIDNFDSRLLTEFSQVC